jgi:hypothetical protein
MFETTAEQAAVVAAFNDAFLGKGQWLRRKMMFCGGMWRREPPQQPDFVAIVSEVGTPGGLIGLHVVDHGDHRTVVLAIRGALGDFAGPTWRDRSWENARLKDHRRNYARWIKRTLKVREDAGEEVS